MDIAQVVPGVAVVVASFWAFTLFDTFGGQFLWSMSSNASQFSSFWGVWIALVVGMEGFPVLWLCLRRLTDAYQKKPREHSTPSRPPTSEPAVGDTSSPLHVNATRITPSLDRRGPGKRSPWEAGKVCKNIVDANDSHTGSNNLCSVVCRQGLRWRREWPPSHTSRGVDRHDGTTIPRVLAAYLANPPFRDGGHSSYRHCCVVTRADRNAATSFGSRASPSNRTFFGCCSPCPSTTVFDDRRSIVGGRLDKVFLFSISCVFLLLLLLLLFLLFVIIFVISLDIILLYILIYFLYFVFICS